MLKAARATIREIKLVRQPSNQKCIGQAIPSLSFSQIFYICEKVALRPEGFGAGANVFPANPHRAVTICKKVGLAGAGSPSRPF
jgi:hypothetical protein